ncbi:hypothetical protein [Paenibacillus sp. 1P07SE]|uniref:hypothetical protein n=1 Tax=Paenibacillus sp. 1P07SE TaxID=3132209 RepID=UPI0039A6EA06
MIAPTDVARCLADAMTGPEKEQRIVEISGPRSYRAMDIAAISEDVLGRSISVQHIAPEAWQSTLLEVGFSDAGTANLMQMTQAVIDGKTTPASSSTPVSYETEFKPYLQEQLRGRN